MIPQVAPLASYHRLKQSIDCAIDRVLQSGTYILGEEVAQFEREFSDTLQLPESIAVANGTDAIVIALRAVGVTHGDGVLVPSHTAGATVSAVVQCGAVPLFVDVSEDDFCVDPNHVAVVFDAHRRGCRIRALIAVHLYGHPAKIDRLAEFCRVNDLFLIEDCAQAQGSRFQGRTVGGFGDVAAFSFYPTKNLGAFGDGGMVCTANQDLASRLRAIRQYGWSGRYIASENGQNSRLDELQAAVLRAKLPSLEADNRRRAEIARHYQDAPGVRHPTCRGDCTHAFHQYVIRSTRRDDLRERLHDAGVGTAIHYPIPVHRQPAFAGFASRQGALPVTDRLQAEILSLPMYPELTDDQVGRVIEAIRRSQ